MSLVNNPAYKQLSETMGPYLAVMEIAQNAREISKSLPNRITDSEAIDFASRGVMPDPKDFPDHRLDRAKSYITYIDDIELRSAIISSYEESLDKNNLYYNYNTITDEPRKTRVRVIMNILWDSRPHKKE